MVQHSAVPLEKLVITTMASGGLSLTLTKAVSWEQFPEYVAAIAEILDAEIDVRVDGVAERVWQFSVDGLGYWIVLKDFGLGVCLDSQGAAASAVIPSIRGRLLSWLEQHAA
jgi:hypothetical protein